MIQNEAELTSNPKALDAGDSPANSPPRPKRKYAKLAMSEAMPREFNAKRPVDQLKNNSATKGPAKKARLGASSWTAMAFPQCGRSINDVIVAIAEGMYRPPANPKPKSPTRIAHKLLTTEIPRSASPMPAVEITIVILWLPRGPSDTAPQHPS